MADIVAYYNKFNEDKRLKSRHGIVEYTVTRHFIDEVLASGASGGSFGSSASETSCESVNSGHAEGTFRIADIGAGTGAYSIPLAKKGYEVTAVELVNYNLGILKKHADENGLSNLKAISGDARKLKKLPSDYYDLTLLLGPMYHLHSIEDKVSSLKEALRITKPSGVVFVGYVMADYAVVKYGFMEGNILSSLSSGALTKDYGVISNEDELYDYVRLNDIDVINSMAGAERINIFAPDGPSDYIRNYLNEMPEEAFNAFIDYQIKNATRGDLLGASSHTVDIVRKIQ